MQFSEKCLRKNLQFIFHEVILLCVLRVYELARNRIAASAESISVCMKAMVIGYHACKEVVLCQSEHGKAIELLLATYDKRFPLHVSCFCVEEAQNSPRLRLGNSVHFALHWKHKDTAKFEELAIDDLHPTVEDHLCAQHMKLAKISSRHEK